MAVKYNYEEINDALDLLKKMRYDCSQSRNYFGNVINKELDVFLRDYVLKHYGFQKLMNLSSEIEENLRIYTDWLSDANVRARQVQLRNEEKSEELDDNVENGGVAQVLYGAPPPQEKDEEDTPKPEEEKKDDPEKPEETDKEDDVVVPKDQPENGGENQVLYGVPKDEEINSNDPKQQEQTQPVTQEENQPISQEQTQPVTQGNYVESTPISSEMEDIKETMSSSTQPKDLSETQNSENLDEVVEKKSSSMGYQPIPTSYTSTPNRTPTYSSKTMSTTSSSSQGSTGVSKTIIAAGAVGLAGTVAGAGLLVGKAMQSYTFTPNDWDELNPVDQERITNTLYRVGYKDKEINAIMNSTFKIPRNELKEHINKIKSAIANYNKFSEEFQKIYNYSIVGAGEVSNYLTFLTMIIDGKSISDRYNMYNIINPYLENPDDVDKTYQGIRPQDYME